MSGINIKSTVFIWTQVWNGKEMEMDSGTFTDMDWHGQGQGH
jgi:hypothetical protein